MNRIGWILCLATLICGSIALSIPGGSTYKSESFTAHCGTARVVCKLDPDGMPVCYVQVPCVRSEGWDTLQQIHFWRSIMRLHPDSALVNSAASRVILGKISMKEYLKLSQEQRDSFKAVWREMHQLHESEKVFITSGKNWFYNPKQIAPRIKRAVEIFDSMGVDPFLAQAVLLIESPVGNLKSESGAYGQFQLMPSVARQFGLKVDSRRDERAIFDKSAMAAAKLFQEICIPYSAKMLDQLGYAYHEQSLWFRLLVMHVYHAGAYNVRNALQMIPSVSSGKAFIQALWNVEYGSFKNAAQNYSQLVLSSYLEFNQYMMNYGLNYRYLSDIK
jgi:hypothetical protein